MLSRFWNLFRPGDWTSNSTPNSLITSNHSNRSTVLAGFRRSMPASLRGATSAAWLR